MPYSSFSIDEVKSSFHLRLDEGEDLFAAVPALAISDLLRITLIENVPLALAISTEKARSELIIAPVLLEVRRQAGGPVSLFSGIDFDVDASRGLNGTCDFLLSRSPEQLIVEAPVVAVVEAKNDNIKSGIGQCIAIMIAFTLFNQQKGQDVPVVYGVVTTGSAWKFLQLSGELVSVDRGEYYISDVSRVVGVLVHMVRGGTVPERA
jgi:hypothetical protein